MRFVDPFARKTPRKILSIAAVIVAVVMGADARGAEAGSTTLSPQALDEIAQLEAEIDSIEARAIARLAVPPDNQIQQIELLGNRTSISGLSCHRTKPYALPWNPGIAPRRFRIW
jgi:hypothetical protein